MQWLTKLFTFAIDYVKRLWGKARHDNERKEAEANLLPSDPEALEYEMSIRTRPI